MDVKRFLRGSAAFGAAAFFGVSAVALIAATPLNDIPGTTEMYSAAETDARIAELGGAGDYATVSNAAVNAGRRATNYTDYAVLRLSQTNSVLSGGPYQTELPYPTNSIPYSAISDAPPAVAVVAPSTNAAAGTAADAKATGDALWTGFTEWVCVPDTYNGKTLHVERENEEWNLYADDQFLDPPISAPSDATNLTFSVYGVTATRHLITPTKTSQLTNDGDGTYPFATTDQIPSPVDISGKLDGAAAYPAWEAGPYGENSIVSHNGKLWKCLLATTMEPPSEDWEEVTLQSLLAAKQDALSQSQLAAVNSGATTAKVATWDGYAALIAAKVSTNALAGQTYNFSRNYDIIRATAAIAEALGATVTNNPTANQGGN